MNNLPDDPLSLAYRQGYQFYQGGQFNQALLEFESVLENTSHKDFTNSLFFKACCLMNLERKPEATLFFEKAILLENGNKAYYNAAGLCALMRGHLQESKKHLQKALELDPYYFEATYHMARLCQALGKPSESIQFLQQCLCIHPGSHFILKEMAGLYAGMGKLDHALDSIKQYKIRFKSDTESSLIISLLYKRKKEYQKSLDYLEGWQGAKAHNLRYYLEKLELCLHLNRPTDFLNTFREVCKFHPDRLLFLSKFLADSLSLGYKEISEEITDLLISHKQYNLTTINVRLELLLQKEGGIEERIKIIQLGEAYFNENQHIPDGELSCFYFLVGQHKEFLKNPLEAVQNYQNAIDLDPDSPATLFLGWILLGDGQYMEAHQAFQKAFENSKNSKNGGPVFPLDPRSDPLFCLSITERILGKKGHGEDLFQQAYKKSPAKLNLLKEEFTLLLKLKNSNLNPHLSLIEADFPEEQDLRILAAFFHFLRGSLKEAEIEIRLAYQIGKTSLFEYLLKTRKNDPTFYQKFNEFLEGLTWR